VQSYRMNYILSAPELGKPIYKNSVGGSQGGVPQVDSFFLTVTDYLYVVRMFTTKVDLDALDGHADVRAMHP
jgi:hypothetical protein